MNNKTNCQEKCSCAIVIPVYKNTLSQTEQLSLNQCFKIFNKRDIHIVCHNEVDTSIYLLIAKEYGIDLSFHILPAKYFDSIQGYNDLCLEPSFYNLFIKYDYMLLYQLDAFVFEDRIDYYTNRHIDFVGAPVFKGYRAANKLDYIGLMNGGFSLRNIKQCKLACEHSMDLRSIRKLYSAKIVGKKNVLSIILYKMGIIKHKPLHWEDMFFCFAAPVIVNDFALASFSDSICFSFDCLPALLYEKNNYRLPMGCHKFENEKNRQFWKEHIDGLEGA